MSRSHRDNERRTVQQILQTYRGSPRGEYLYALRALYDELIVAVAGLVAEVQIAGYRTGYVEPEVRGRAAHVVRAVLGLPICGRKKCQVQFDYECILQTGLPICGRKKCKAPCGSNLDDIVEYAEAEAFALLQANWPLVKRVVNALCKQDRFLLPDLASEKQISI